MTTPYTVTGPPVELFRHLPPEHVRAAYTWFAEESNADALTCPVPLDHSDGRREVAQRLGEVVSRCVTDEVLAWLAHTHVAARIAQHTGPSPEGQFWTIPRIAFPAAVDCERAALHMVDAADQVLRTVIGNPHAVTSVADSSLVLLRLSRQLADRMINDVARGTEPSKVSDIGLLPVSWSLRAMLMVFAMLLNTAINPLELAADDSVYTEPAAANAGGPGEETSR